ncbi:MAG TPA: helix-turn-helix domain-containing protein [Gammaproteobacteria bacterium]|nr:helix-turn-helix domain-containing protein [Gammaproteobacteria bacterium]
MVIYVSDAQLAQRYNISRSTVWRWVNRGILPKPTKLSEQCTRWKLAEVERRDLERENQAA